MLAHEGHDVGRHLVAPEARVAHAGDRGFVDEGKWHVEALESQNGTLLNGRKITKHEIRSGDRIRFGFPDGPEACVEIDDAEPGDFTIATVPARFAELGDLHADRNRARGQRAIDAIDLQRVGAAGEIVRNRERRVEAPVGRNPRGAQQAWRQARDLGREVLFHIQKPELFVHLSVGQRITIKLDAGQRAVGVMEAAAPELPPPSPLAK
mgnify:CR=1 FL=1